MALCLSQKILAAREAFEECVQMCPDLIQAWVSWAQFEKRAQQGCMGNHLHRCRSVLQRGLTLNPNNAKLCQVKQRHSHTYFNQKRFNLPAPDFSCTHMQLGGDKHSCRPSNSAAEGLLREELTHKEALGICSQCMRHRQVSCSDAVRCMYDEGQDSCYCGKQGCRCRAAVDAKGQYRAAQ